MSTSTEQNTELRDPDRTVAGEREITHVWDLAADPDGGTRQAVVKVTHHKASRGGTFSAMLLNQTEEVTASAIEQRMGPITDWYRLPSEPVARYSNVQLERFAERTLERLRSLYEQDTDNGRVRGYFQVQS